MLNFHKIAIKFLQKSVLEDPKTWITFPQKGYSLLWSFRSISCSCVLKEIKNCLERNCIVCNFGAISAMESQKSGRENQNKETNDFRGFILLQTQLYFPHSSRNTCLDSWFLSKRNLTRKWVASCFENNFHYDLKLERFLARFLKHFPLLNSWKLQFPTIGTRP